VTVTRAAAPIAALLAAVCALALSACGNTLQDRPIGHNTLETMIVGRFPVYWLGGTFHRLQITEAGSDPGGAFSLQYGDCLEGGQGTCVPPLRMITSPDNSFLPIGGAAHRAEQVRGVSATLARGGRTIVVATGGVVVDIVAHDASLARAALLTMVPINEPGAPGAPLPAPQPDTGFGDTPLPSQEPVPLRPLR
jgi:hypothetical protein